MIAERDASMTFERRSFLKLTGATIISGCVGMLGLGACSAWRNEAEIPFAPESSFSVLENHVVVQLSAVSSLSRLEGAVRLVLGEKGVREGRLIVIQSNRGKYHALVDHCTHNGKKLYYLKEYKLLRCHSGSSYFDMSGVVIKGPAEKPLEVFPTMLDEDRLIIELKDAGR